MLLNIFDCAIPASEVRQTAGIIDNAALAGHQKLARRDSSE
jgi:hypothetical protein